MVWGDSVHVVVYASLASNGTRVRAPGRLCLTYQQQHHTDHVERCVPGWMLLSLPCVVVVHDQLPACGGCRCVEVVESTYSEGISVTVEVAAGASQALHIHRRALVYHEI